MHPLVKLAKDTINAQFTDKDIEVPQGYDEKQGAFVTINKEGTLRGCIGYITTDKPLSQTIQEAARAAATSDPRFTPLREEELPNTTIEVSVLSKPKKVPSTDPMKRQEAFEAGKTGLIITKGWRSGLLLPQVFDEETSAQEALEMTCEKAGLPKNAWKEPGTNIYTFTATVHKEN